MTRAPKRGRALRAPKSGGGATVYVLLMVLLVLLSVLVYYGVRWYRAVATGLEGLGPMFATRPPVTGTPAPTLAPMEPKNILLLGVDRREGQQNARSDVNIVVHVDPARRFASMLSIPRDTRTYIPGYGFHKINAAYSLGEQSYPGGGPILAKETVAQFLNLSIDYYAEVDFQGFERIVDHVGGIDVDVPVPLVDNQYPTADYGYTRIYIPAGLQHMDGATALIYARSRHADSDLGRNLRQQQVLVALRSRILSRIRVTNPEELAALLQQLGATLKTDLELGDLLNLYLQAPTIGPENIAFYSLDWHVLCEISGTFDLEVCNYPLFEEIVRNFQADPGTRRLREEAAQIEVRNGTLTCTGCAAATAEYLRRQGFTVIRAIQDENAGTYSTTLVLDAGDHPFTRELLAQLLRVQPAGIRQGPNGSDLADIVVILGDDFRVPRD